MGKALYKKRLLDVRQDRLDLRDRTYQPALLSLPENFPETSYIDEILKCYRKNNMILDQGEDGACSGYALASVVNYLLWDKQLKTTQSTKPIELVSAKMLFNLARIYDEWDGEDYEGSSCRGAMKGWHKHGVCGQNFWEFKEDEPKKGWEENSVEKPLGAYYRVNKDSISDIQSALCEVGALYVSASIHDGWWKLTNNRDKDIKDIERDLPTIDYDAFPMGNHAFVIVGYTRHGFIIQNSWGRGWGNCGFAILTYHEWLQNGLDVWVAAMGVPINLKKSSQTITSQSLSSASTLEEKSQANKVAPNNQEQAYNHTLVLNANGRAKHTIINTSSLERSIEIISYVNLQKWLQANKKHRKVAIYALGGLQNEKEYIAKIQIMLPYFLNNNVYPIFLTWQHSYQEAIEHSIERFFKETIEGKDKKVEEKILKEPTALDRAIENHCKNISTRGIWVEMKEQSLNSVERKVKGFNRERSGVLYLLTKALKKLSVEFDNELEIHAIAHSAGSELLATAWLERLAKEKLTLSSMHLLAPTTSIQDANKFIIKAYQKGVFEKKNIHIYMLDQEMECLDSIGKYSKSLLYLISRSLEKIHKTPLLGLLNSWDERNITIKDGIFNTTQLKDLRKWQKFAYEKENNLSPYILGKDYLQLACSDNNDALRLGHKSLDSSIFIFERVIKIISRGEEEKTLKFKIKKLC